MDWEILLCFPIMALFVLHEMDAVKNKEWRMIIGLNRLPDQWAYIIFMLLHAPLFTLLFVYFNDLNSYIIILFDFLMVLHSIAHWFFRKHKENSFDFFSNILIGTLGLLALLHLILLCRTS